MRGEIPIAPAPKSKALHLALHQQPHRDRLHAPRGQSASNFLPQQGTQRVTVQPIEHAAGLLGLDQVRVEGPRLLDRVLNGLARDFGKDHPPDRDFGLEQLAQVPADALPLAVFVGRQDQLGGVLERLLELGDDFPLVLGNHVEGFKVVFDVDAKRGPRLLLLLDLLRDFRGIGGEIADVPHAGHHGIVPSQIPADLAGLGRRLHDDQSLVFFDGHENIPYGAMPLWPDRLLDLSPVSRRLQCAATAGAAARLFSRAPKPFELCRRGNPSSRVRRPSRQRDWAMDRITLRSLSSVSDCRTRRLPARNPE